MMEKAVLLAVAEGLSDSKQWRTASKTYRNLRKKWQHAESVGQPEDDKLWELFLHAEQKYLDRRAHYFLKGHIRKGQQLHLLLQEKQDAAAQLRDSIDVRYKKINSYRQQLTQITEPRHQQEITQFITDTIATLEADIETQTRALRLIENEIAQQSTRFCGA